MEILGILFLFVFLAITAGALYLFAVVVGVWQAIVFALILWLIYRAATYDSAPNVRISRSELNAFQQSMGDD